MPIGAVEAGASEAPVRVEARLCRWVLARVVARLAVVLLLGEAPLPALKLEPTAGILSLLHAG